MRRRNKSERHANHERWLVSYADFITLLFAFFVVMYSTAQVDKQKVGKLALSIQVAFNELGVFPGSAVPSSPPGMQLPLAPNNQLPPGDSEDLTSLQSELEKSLEPEILRNEVAIISVPDGLVISLREVGFFDSGSSTMQAHANDAFRRIAELLLRYPHRIRIEGHTDNVPIHNPHFASNWQLSTARATELVQVLIDQYQFPPQRLSAAGYAQYHPVASNDSVDGRAQNRRVDVLVLGSQVTAPARGEVPADKPDPRTPVSGTQSSPG